MTLVHLNKNTRKMEGNSWDFLFPLVAFSKGNSGIFLGGRHCQRCRHAITSLVCSHYSSRLFWRNDDEWDNQSQSSGRTVAPTAAVSTSDNLPNINFQRELVLGENNQTEQNMVLVVMSNHWENGLRLEQGRLRFVIGKIFLTGRVVKHCNRLPRAVVEPAHRRDL